MNQRLFHNAAVAAAEAMRERLKHLVPADQMLSVYFDLYVINKASVEAYELQLNRMQQRLKPARN